MPVEAELVEQDMLTTKNRDSPYRISAVIPTYNRAKLLPRAIESVLTQSAPPTEIVVVDDGSSDDTLEILAEYGDEIITIRQKNGGSASARHLGLLATKSEWVAFLDSDDVWVTDHLDRIRHAISSTDGKANYYFADVRRPDQNGENYFYWERCDFEIPGPYQMIVDATDVVLRPGFRQPMMIQASVLNRQSYLSCGGFLPQLRYRDDTHLFIKLGLEGPICAVSGVGTIMTADDHPTNRLTEQYNDSREGIRMQAVMFQDLLDYFGTRLTNKQRRHIRSRLATAHWRLARNDLQKCHFGSSMRYLGCAIAADPKHILNKFIRA